ncbi:MAG: ABC transporter permease [Anaerolineales bacterium]|jgi:peptide/nickel transport system permease protein
MIQLLVRRIVLLIPVLLGILLVTFAIVHAIPGDPCVVMLGERATPEACAGFRQRLGLNDPIPVQFLRYVGNIAQGNLGTSIKDGRPVVDVLAERLPMTMELTFGAIIFAATFGVLFGVVSAIRQNSMVDVATMILANIGVSMPVFWLGLMLAYVFALTLKGTPFWIPPSGRMTSGISLTPLAEAWHFQSLPGLPTFLLSLVSNSVILHSLLIGDLPVLKDAVWHLILPSVAVGTIPLAIIARMTRSSLLEILGQDYIRTARAKGLVERLVLVRHAMRNALIPIVTIVGLEVGGLLSGAVLTETVFALPGMGTAIVTAILGRDYPIVQAFTLVVALIYVSVNLIVDLSYAYLDPRIRPQ